MFQNHFTMNPPIRPEITKRLIELIPGGEHATFDLLSGVYSYTSVLSTITRMKKIHGFMLITKHERNENGEWLYVWKVQ